MSSRYIYRLTLKFCKREFVDGDEDWRSLLLWGNKEDVGLFVRNYSAVGETYLIYFISRGI